LVAVSKAGNSAAHELAAKELRGEERNRADREGARRTDRMAGPGDFAGMAGRHAESVIRERRAVADRRNKR
jgi:hypothetical protein